MLFIMPVCFTTAIKSTSSTRGDSKEADRSSSNSDDDNSDTDDGASTGFSKLPDLHRPTDLTTTQPDSVPSVDGRKETAHDRVPLEERDLGSSPNEWQCGAPESPGLWDIVVERHLQEIEAPEY